MITLHYKKRNWLWRKLGFKRTCSFQLPERFDELDPKQFIKIAGILFRGGDELQCKVQALHALSGLSLLRWILLKPVVINNALPHVEWVFEEAKFTRQLLPAYKGYHGPASDFDNLRMKEFHFSEMYYRDIINRDAQALDKLVAVLYREPVPKYNSERDSAGDIRRPFNHNEIAFHAKRISHWPPAVKQAIFLWYDACRQDLIRNNEWVFNRPSSSDFESEFDTGLYGTMRSLAGDKLGSVEKIESMYVHTAMLEISLVREEEAYWEDKLKANTRS